MDMILNPESELNESANYREYVNNWNEAMSEAYKSFANEKSSQSIERKGKSYTIAASVVRSYDLGWSSGTKYE